MLTGYFLTISVTFFEIYPVKPAPSDRTTTPPRSSNRWWGIIHGFFWPFAIRTKENRLAEPSCSTMLLSGGSPFNKRDRTDCRLGSMLVEMCWSLSAASSCARTSVGGGSSWPSRASTRLVISVGFVDDARGCVVLLQERGSLKDAGRRAETTKD